MKSFNYKEYLIHKEVKISKNFFTYCNYRYFFIKDKKGYIIEDREGNQHTEIFKTKQQAAFFIVKYGFNIGY